MKDIGGEKGLLKSLWNTSDFQKVLEKFQQTIETTGALTAANIAAMAPKSESLQ